MQRTASKDYTLKVDFINALCFLGSLFCVVFQIPVSYLYLFPYLKALGPTSPNPNPFFLVFVFLSCVGFVFLDFALFLFVCCWSVLGVWGVCCFYVIRFVFVSSCMFCLIVLQCFCCFLLFLVVFWLDFVLVFVFVGMV